MKYFISEKSADAYTPPGHSDTYNRRLAGGSPGSLKNMEVIIGEMGPEGHAEGHAHADCDQAMYIISGRMSALVGEEKAELEAGCLVSIPAGAYHEISNPGPERLKFLLIYSPPRS